jgi:glycosyltransferase involved in cell wall biosynthesis
MEALSCGLPCLVSDIPANREWISEGVNGWLFPDGDAEALAAKIGAALEERNSLIKIRQAARCTAEEKADWRKNFSTLLDTYRQTVLLNA